MYLHWDEQTIADFSDANVNAMYNRGFVFTRKGNGIMQQTRSVRVDLSKFELSSENRRILRKIADCRLQIADLPYTQYDWAIGKLAKDFYETKFGKGVFSANKIKELLTEDRKDFNRLLIYNNAPHPNPLRQLADKGGDDVSSPLPRGEHEGGETTTALGYCIAVETNDILHYSYPFYNLKSEIKNLGLGMMTQAVVWAKENGKKYIYLGSAQRKSDTYKFQFKGINIFEQTKWNTD